MNQRTDFLIIGGGIVGLATAWQLLCRFPDASIRILEKEQQVAQHQSGRNSGVLHSGIYYKPNSIKANTCREGRSAMVAFCEQEGIAHEICGKIIVATKPGEVPRLGAIEQRGQENGISCERIDAKQMQQLEPAVAGLEALHVKQAGIVDYPEVCRRIALRLLERGQYVELGHKVTGISQTRSSVTVATQSESFEAGFLVTCGGLYSDRLVRMSGLEPPAKIVPFRGEYYELLPEHRGLCKNLVYPVPDPNFPFLGVHFTRMVNGDVECGPNAVFALAREGYSWGNIKPGELFESLRYPGFLKLAAKHWKMGIGEVQSAST